MCCSNFYVSVNHLNFTFYGNEESLIEISYGKHSHLYNHEMSPKNHTMFSVHVG